ncbi:MAG TPA: carbohydrate kinase family protein [Candidatus Lokiarchaeia archaeon]|nr:carbohydrate kinase family protein [Candidatus Lokiarchaeia archaeon]
MYDVIAIGSACLDIVEEISDIMEIRIRDRRGEEKLYTAIESSTKLNVKNVRYLPGGSAANICCDTALFMFRNTYVGKLGEDNSGDIIFQDLLTRNVVTDHVIRTEEAGTAVSIILMVGGRKDRSILSYKGANDMLTPEDIPEDIFQEGRVFVWTSLTTENATNAILKGIDLAKQNGMVVFGAPSMSIIMGTPDKAKQIISQTDILSFNEEELTALVGEAKTVYQQIEMVHEMGVKVVSVTLGSKGSILSNGYKVVETSTYEVDVVDTTGAGDAFASGILVSHLAGEPIEEMAKFASAMASMKISTWGSRFALPGGIDQLKEFIETHDIQQTVRNL